MRRIVLHELVETEDSLEVGAAVGQILLGDDGPKVQAATAERRHQVEAVLAEPLALRGGDPEGIRRATVARPVTWRDGDDYVRALLERLEKRDVRLHGRLLE